jgi:glycosyl transferase family 87
MNLLRRLATYRILDVGAVTLTVSVLVWWAVVLPRRWNDYDFNHYYVSGRMLLAGQNPYTTSLEAVSQALGFRYAADLPIATYPPAFLWIFAALAVLPPRSAFAVWVALELVCLAVILWLTRRLLGERLSGRGWLFVVALATISRTVSYNLYYSQAQLLLAALVLAGYAAHRAGRHGWACVAVSTAGMLKFYPFALLPWFIWSGGGSVRGRCGRLIGVIGFVLAAVALTGPGLWRDFLRYGMPATAGWEEAGRTFHFSLPALITNLGYLHDNFQPSVEDRQWWWIAGMLVGVGVFAAAYSVCVAARRDPEAQFCLLCTAMLIGTVTVQGHYFVFLVFPLTVAAVRIMAQPTGGQIICLVLVVLAFNCVDPPDSPFLGRHMLLFLLASDLPLYGLLALAAFFWRELRGRPNVDNGNAAKGEP